jgi:tetratricopeptide (TPR) repeat protein
MLWSRAGLYMQRRQYALALEDYSTLFEATREPDHQLARMEAAYAAGQSAVAQADAEALTARGVTDARVPLILARVLIEGAQPGENTIYQRAIALLQQADGALDPSVAAPRAVVQEYLARAHLALGNTLNAQEAIDEAISLSDTGSRRYWRGRILEARSDEDAAIAEYEWVLAWSQVYPFPFRADVEDRLAELRG